MRVIVAMSGGVDSSVAAARLVDRGFDVVGVTLHLWDYPDETPERSRCCAPEDAHDARLVADHLDIPHYTFDRRELFARDVVEPFVAAYLSGATPSPCVWCNRSVKMRELFPLAERLGAAAVATGHYARVERDAGGAARLYQGRDAAKDQSYFLHTLRADELDRVLLPLGDATKPEVRDEAVQRGLPGAMKGDSQELCFVPTGRYADFVEERAAGRVRPGSIVDAAGRELGRHGGIHRYTVGQRRGLGVTLGSSRPGEPEPAFVSHLDASTGAVMVGPRGEALFDGAELADGVFADDVDFPLRARVRVRSRHQGEQATIVADGDGWRVRFDRPVHAVSVGQYAVAYDGDRVLGGATIRAAIKCAE